MGIANAYLEDTKTQKLAQWVKLAKQAELVQRLTMIKLVEMAQPTKRIT